jgi:hypothetical protein
MCSSTFGRPRTFAFSFALSEPAITRSLMISHSIRARAATIVKKSSLTGWLCRSGSRRSEIHAQGVNLLNGIQQILGGPRKAVQFPDHENLDSPPPGLLHQPGVLGPLRLLPAVALVPIFPVRGVGRASFFCTRSRVTRRLISQPEMCRCNRTLSNFRFCDVIGKEGAARKAKISGCHRELPLRARNKASESTTKRRLCGSRYMAFLKGSRRSTRPQRKTYSPPLPRSLREHCFFPACGSKRRFLSAPAWALLLSPLLQPCTTLTWFCLLTHNFSHSILFPPETNSYPWAGV